MSWAIIIDRRVPADGVPGLTTIDRKQVVVDGDLLSDAVELGLEEFGLVHEESGEFQITAVYRGDA